MHEGRVRTREQALAPDADDRSTATGFANATWDLALATRDTAPDIQRVTFTTTVTRGAARTVAAHLHAENPRPVDLSAGDTLGFEFELHRFPCEEVHGLFARRTALFPQCATPPAKLPPFSAAWDILEQKHNTQNWDEARGLYRVGIPWDARPDSDKSAQYWQNGWCGGGMPTLALSQEGTPESAARARPRPVNAAAMWPVVKDAAEGTALFPK